MQIKVDTKEKFTTITLIEPKIYVNMAVELTAICADVLLQETKNVILNLQPVSDIEEEAAEAIAKLQQKFYDANASFVICEIKPTVEEVFEKMELLEFLNATPTESEAWDIVQMEEIERELLDDGNVEFNTND